MTGQGDKWWILVLNALSHECGSASERQQILVRIGKIAEAYSFADAITLETVFGSHSQEGYSQKLS